MRRKQETLSIQLPQQDYNLAQELLAETGKIPNLNFELNPAADPNWFSTSLPNSNMAIRMLIREAFLASLGYQENDWIENRLNFLDSYDRIISALGSTGVENYDWEYGRWNRGTAITGPLERYHRDLRKDNYTKPYINRKHGIVLFSDEFEQLEKRQKVTTLHLITHGETFISIKKEVFAIVNDSFYRLRGLIAE